MRFLATAVLALGICSASAAPLDLLTFNIRYDNPDDGEDAWPKRRAMVGEWLRSEAPDVVGLQEALRHQIDAIREAAPFYAEYGVGRNDGKKAGEYCAILYKPERFEAGEGGTFWLSDKPAEVASTSWGNEIPRICTWLHLTDKETGRGFYVFNTHWDHKSQPSRDGAAKLIIERIAAREKKGDPVVLMGDFNAAEENTAILTLKHAPPGVDDTFRLLHPDEPMVRTFHGFKGGEARGGKIDHLFVLRDTVAVKSAEIVRYNRDGRFLSDHYPVRAVLQFK